MKKALNQEQYRKYLVLINVTNNHNRLFSKEEQVTYFADAEK
ncbi:MAG: hypothetical protein PHN48_02100 [Parabacteroides sp.]|nr:hypothetical protein [Parabacteroides sp.]